MGDFSALASCAEISAEQAEDAARSQEDLQALLARCVQIARPEDGCPKILMALARVVGKPWLEAELRVELSGDEATTTLALVYDHGFGIRERMMPAVLLAAGFDEFQRAVRLAPKLVEPLRVEEEEGRIVLTQSARMTSAPPPPIKIDETSMTDGSTKPPPPAEPERAETSQTIRRFETVEAEDDVVPADIDMREPIAANGPTPHTAALNPHTRPTRRMNTIDPEILRAATARRDPRRDED